MLPNLHGPIKSHEIVSVWLLRFCRIIYSSLEIIAFVWPPLFSLEFATKRDQCGLVGPCLTYISAQIFTFPNVHSGQVYSK